MKRLSFRVGLSTVAFGFAVVSIVIVVGMQARPALALTQPLEPAQIEKIKNTCIDTQSVLNRLHANDALIRVNRGQLYESVASKLMAPFNGRIAINKLDGSALIATTTNYEQTLEKFRTDYSTYERSMSQLLKADCRSDPEQFYNLIVETRSLRTATHDDVVELQAQAVKYKQNFDSFSQDFRRDGAL